MKFLSAAAVGVAALALQTSAAPLRVDVWVAAPAGTLPPPISFEEALKNAATRPNVPVRVAGYGYVRKAGESSHHPHIQVFEVPDRSKANWVYHPAAGGKGGVAMSSGNPGPASAVDEAFRNWVMTHPDIQHNGDAHVLKHRPMDIPMEEHMGCRQSWKHSFNRFANSLREALGFAPIQPMHPPPRPYVPAPPRAQPAMFADGVVFGSYNLAEKDDNVMRRPDSRWPMPFHHQGQGRHHRFGHHRGDHWHKKPFGRRIMHALYILGPVEGRIVAFVLGLGIGALIRVLFVMGLLAYRSITGRDSRRIMLPEDEEISEPIIIERVYEIREKEEAPAYTAVVPQGEQTLAPPS